MKGADLVTWGLLIWIGSRIFGGENQNPAQLQAQEGTCSYQFGSNMQANVTIPYWIRQMSRPDTKPFTFESE